MIFRPMQPRSASLVEAGANVLVGYLVALLAQPVVFPLVGIRSSFAQEVQIAAAFTLVSLLRSYLLRRLFERSECGSMEGAVPDSALQRPLGER